MDSDWEESSQVRSEQNWEGKYIYLNVELNAHSFM